VQPSTVHYFIIVILVIPFMQGVCNYILETNLVSSRVYRVYIAVAVL
jgi:hypothetical protein